jgi:opacity protein-like surface antigen
LPCVDNGTTCQTFFFSNSARQSNALLCSYTVGAGLDWARTRNIFARGEFEFMQFAPISNIVWPAAASAPGSNSEARLKRACF